MSHHCNIRRVDRMADIFMACVLGALAAVAWLHWGACSASDALVCGALPAMTAITPTRLTPWRRAVLWLHELRLKALLRSFETEAEHWREAAEVAPLMLVHCQDRIATLRGQLAGGSGRAPELRR